MLSSSSKLIIGLVAFWALITTASAQSIHPRCATMRDKVGCTCALENGGTIVQRPGGGSRWVSRPGGNWHVNEAFVQCMRRHGRQ
jgi:hypothetical protein